MLRKLEKDSYSMLADREELLTFPLISAVIEKKQLGNIFTSEAGDVFVLHRSGFSYYSGRNEGSDLFDFIQSSKQLPKYFHVYDPPAFLVEEMKNMNGFGYRIRKRVQLVYEKQAIDMPGQLMDGYTLSVIDASSYDCFAQMGIAVEEKFWASKEDFLQNGIGVCIFDKEGDAVSICYSACVAGGRAEVDILTRPDHQRKGLAKAVTKAYIASCLAKGLTPNWDCFKENTGSLRTALDTGFVIKKEYLFLSLYNNR